MAEERQTKEIEVSLRRGENRWVYEVRTLRWFSDQIGALIAAHGDQATIYISGEEPEVELTYTRPETDEEMAGRLNAEELKRSRAELRQAGWDKLTPAERRAFGIPRP